MSTRSARRRHVRFHARFQVLLVSMDAFQVYYAILPKLSGWFIKDYKLAVSLTVNPTHFPSSCCNTDLFP